MHTNRRWRGLHMLSVRAVHGGPRHIEGEHPPPVLGDATGPEAERDGPASDARTARVRFDSGHAERWLVVG